MPTPSEGSLRLRFAISLMVMLALPVAVRAQIAGESVNMVSGTQWPGGDPFLQRQNEPSVAVSSANTQHLLAGANDYRSVDLPNPLDISCQTDPSLKCAESAKPKMPGDAWLGIFKSYNGGQTWQSVLMPGYPQDITQGQSQGAQSPLRNCVKGDSSPTGNCTSAAD